MKKNISKFDELVIGALQDDVFSAVEETLLEERKEDSSTTSLALTSKDGYFDMFLRLHIPVKKLLLVVVGLSGIIAVVFKLNPNILQMIEHLLAKP